ncbi:unnamed protein product [Clavelina lepadiformis]|uniref:E3 ubiquitin-protein ligase RNF10 n=1 Tax=Clavelina lepadiformis TaxID=159417 RepID=A0ABP0GIT0_CLALP
MSSSPTMSSRSTVTPVNKCSSTENVHSKSKDDRARNYGNGGKFKQRHDNGSSSKQFNNGRNQLSYYKQPKSRNTWAGKRAQVTKEQREEMGGKKCNLNHLLKFTFDDEEAVHAPSRIYSKSYGGGSSVFNKEKFIQANCQLVLKEGGDYSVYSADPDAVIVWENIEKVNMWSRESPSCPICLFPPYAARITKCGHMFCWPCILHYLALDDKSWRKCPICHEAVKKEHLKSVNVYEDKSYDVQSVIMMKLMKRFRGSILSLPGRAEESSCEEASYMLDDKLTAWDQRRMKYLVTTSSQVLTDIVKKDKEQLEFKLAVETDELERTFIESALEMCSAKENALLQNLQQSHDKCKVENDEKCQDETAEDVKASSCSDDVINDVTYAGASQCTDEVVKEHNKSLDTATNNTHIYYFYQAADGQHIYLHPINIKCLLQQYGSFKNCPSELSVKILELDRYTMNEVLRKRHRYLSHLPLSLEFCIAEVDLRPPVVSIATLNVFREELEHHASKRRRKARDEKKILRKMQNEAMRKQGKYPAARISLESQQQFPQIQRQNSSGSFSVLLPSPGTTPCDDESIMMSSSPPMTSSESSHGTEPGPSFAQMLKSPRSIDVPAWPRQTFVPRPSEPSLVEETTEEGYIPPPNYQSAFGEALSSALDNLAPPSGRKSKKGKKSKVLLFSTSGQQHQ